MSKQRRYSMNEVSRTKFSRITALVDMPEHGVKAGDMGGIIESEFNLPQDGTGWIDDSSSISELCQVKAGLVCESSNLEGNVIIEGGRIEDSFMIGNLVVSGDTLIKDCEIFTIPFSQSKIESSVLESVNTKGECHIEQSKIRAARRFTTEKTLTVVKSDVYINIGKAKSLSLINSSLRTKRLTAFEPLHLENGIIEAERRLFISDESHSLSNKDAKTMIKGFAENPIEIKGENIKLTNSNLLDAVKVTGDIHLYDSTISGSATLEMKKADIFDSTISELATVRQITDGVVTLDKLVLSGDNKYEC